MISPSSPPLGRRASDLAFVRDLVRSLYDEMVRPPAWAFEDMQEAGEEAMRRQGEVYANLTWIGDPSPLTVWARSRILEACKKALKEVECA